VDFRGSPPARAADRLGEFPPYGMARPSSPSYPGKQL
jgi:hypothetical protein